MIVRLFDVNIRERWNSHQFIKQPINIKKILSKLTKHLYYKFNTPTTGPQ